MFIANQTQQFTVDTVANMTLAETQQCIIRSRSEGEGEGVPGHTAKV
jgi:hypothetical protein